METVVQKPVKFKVFPFAFSENSARAFYCNAIVFINSGTVNVKINDIFTLAPNASIEISGDQNEIDTSIYKIAFELGGTNLLQGFIKYNDGAPEMSVFPANAFYTKEKDKPGFTKADRARRSTEARKGRVDNKYHNKKKIEF